jgi:hypothetical protein
MNRIVPTFIAAAVVLMLMFRGLGTAESSAANATNATELAVESVTRDVGGVLAFGTPQFLFIALLAGAFVVFKVS